MTVQPLLTRNILLRQLAPDDFALLGPYLEPVELGLREQVVVAGAPITHAWFFDTAVASVVAATAGGRQAEVGLTGREGMIDVALVNGVDASPLEAFAQIPGLAWRMPATRLREAMAASESLQMVMLNYAQSFLVQVSNTALVNVSYTLEQRLARWLLMTHDRVDGNEIAMTHQFLSLMLGVRRAGVTMTVHKLESAAVIRAKRALMIITDRAGLREIARDAYGLAEMEYARLLGTDFTRPAPRSNGGYTSSAMRA